MEDPQLPPSRPHLGSTLSSSSLQLQHLQRSQHSRSGEVSETDSGWSDVFKDSDSSLEDFDTYGDYNHNHNNNDAISRQSTISSGNDSEDDGQDVQVEGTPSNHTRSILTSDEDDWASDEDDMWNSSGDWDGNDTTLEQQQAQPAPSKPQRSNSRSSLDEYLQNDNTHASKRDESTADSTDPSAAGSPQKRICHDQDRSGSLPPATGKALHDLSTPLGLADTALDFSEQTQEIIFDDHAGEEEDEEEAWESQRNLQSSRSNGGWDEEEEEEEDEVNWDDPDDDGDWEDEGEKEENKQEDSAAWDYDRVGTEDEDDQDWGEEADVKDKADGDIKAAKSAASNREPTTFAQQFVVSSSTPNQEHNTTRKSIVLDASEEQHKGREEEKEEIEPWHESDSSFSHVFEAVGSEHMRERSQQQQTIPEGKALTPIAAASLAPTIKTDNSFRSKSQPSIPQNPARQAPTKRYHIHKGQSRTPQDWECLLVQWEHMERAKKKEEQLRNRQTAAANYVQSTGAGSPLSDESNIINRKNPPNKASEERSNRLETASNDPLGKKSKKNTGKCLGNIVFPFSLAGKKKSKRQKNPESAR